LLRDVVAAAVQARREAEDKPQGKHHPDIRMNSGGTGASYRLRRIARLKPEVLEPLLPGDDWKLCGAGFDDVNAFMESLRLDKFRMIATERKRIAQRIKELQPLVSNRQIARTLGISDMTVGRDLATNVAPDNGDARGSDEPSATNVAASLSGREAAITVNRRERSGQPDLAVPNGAEPLAEHGAIGRGRNRDDNVISTAHGNSAAYLVARLKRDAPDYGLQVTQRHFHAPSAAPAVCPMHRATRASRRHRAPHQHAHRSPAPQQQPSAAHRIAYQPRS
jgi:hypothetical protein